MKSSNNPTEKVEPEKSEAPQPRALGHPVHIFIDTSVYQASNFAFDGKLLQSVAKAASEGDLVLLVPDVTRREVRARIKEAIKVATEAFAPAKKSLKILRADAKNVLGKALAEPQMDLSQKRIIRRWKQYRKTIEAVETRAADVNPSDVFDDYFKTRPPFENTERKKSEFPDAFALYSVLAYAKKHQVRVALVSHDNGMKTAAARFSEFQVFDSLATALEHAVSARMSVTTVKFHSVFSLNRETLEKDICDTFPDRGFYWDHEDGYDTYVEEVYDVEVKSLDVSLIDVTDGWAEVAGEATIWFRASASYPDPDMSYRDDETDRIMAFGKVNATVSTEATMPVSFRVDVDALDRGKLVIGDLSLNNGSDVWFRDVEIEKLTGDYDSE